MNYKKLYDDIIQHALSLNRIKGKTYYENHHIIPKSLGGSDQHSNLVLLTAKEHFICHHLLTKIYPNSDALRFAFWSMCNQNRITKITSRVYENAKKNFSLVNSKRHKGKKISEHIVEMHRQRMITNNIHKKGKESHLYGVPWDQDAKDKVSKTKLNQPEKNGNFKGWYKTPFGEFASCRQANDHIKILSYDKIFSRCKQNTKIITKVTLRYNPDLTDLHLGKTFQDLGWGFVPK